MSYNRRDFIKSATLGSLAGGILLTTRSWGAETPAAAPKAARKNLLNAKQAARADSLIANGVKFLISRRAADGGWSLSGQFKAAMTGLALKTILGAKGYSAESPAVKKGFTVLLKMQQGDGSFRDPKFGKPNYGTSIAVVALAAGGAKYKASKDRAVKYLRTIQIKAGDPIGDPTRAGQTVPANSPYVGGVSYGAQHGRPDLNNLGWWMEAMHDAGVKADDPDMQRALTFVTRCQNRSESNPSAWAKQGPNDNGMIYAPAKRDPTVGESKAGVGPGGRGLRSYGSISYVGWKSMLYAGVTKNDPRVKSLYAWFRRYWTLDANPNMPKSRSQEGMYFYYLVFAKALKAWKIDEVADRKDPNLKHNWRAELVDALGKRVNKNGSFLNATASRWEEGNPILTTCYAVQALETAVAK